MAEADGTMGIAIQERLRLQADFAQSRAHINSANNCREAADYIDSLEKQRDEARAKAIEECARISDGYYSEDNECSKDIRALNGGVK